MVMKDLKQKGKKQPEKPYSFHYSKDLEGIVMEIHDIKGMLPLFIKIPKVPSIGTRKINLVNKKSGLHGLQMT